MGDLINMDVLFGILLGIALPFALWVATQDIPVAVDKAPVQPDNVVHAYQDLIAGILALIGAAGAVSAVIYQIRDARKMEEERRERQMYAARSMMPHALTSLCEYAESCCKELKDVAGKTPPKNGEQVKFPPKFNIPQISELPLAPLQQLLEFGDEEIQNNISRLLQALQVQQSRLQHRNMPLSIDVFGYQYYTRIAEALEVHARAGALFPYARRTAETAPNFPTPDNMLAVVNHCGFWDLEWAPLKTFISERWKPYQPIRDDEVEARRALLFYREKGDG